VKYKGRLIATMMIMTVHTLYTLYYFKRDGMVDVLDLLGYPVIFIISYWSGLQYDKAVYFSEKDTLTNIYNRRYVISSFDRFLSLAKRSNTTLFVMLLDCDNFKEINDRYNHHLGDEVLRHISKILLGCTRKGDIVSRWGGDEFLILGRYNDSTDIQTIGLEIHRRLVQLSHEMGFSISISMGSAVYAEDRHHDLSGLIREADNNMYNMKIVNKQAQTNRTRPEDQYIRLNG
jgi:diguanylate cyclase (GGDEF)-like protein